MSITDGRSNRGFILLAVYVVAIVVSVFSIAFFSRNNAFQMANERSLNKMVAFNMAESGVDWAINQLRANPDYAGTPSYVSMDTDLVRGGFTVTVTIAADNPRVRIIEARGFAPGHDSGERAYQAVTVSVYGRYDTSSIFNYAVFATDRIRLTDTDKVASVDSYDSRNDAYGDTNKGSGGNIAVNGTQGGAVTLSGKTAVSGDVFIGPDGNTAIAISVGPQASITGTRSNLSQEEIFRTPSTLLPSAEDLSISSGTENLSAGTYHFASLSVTGTGTLNFTGPATIFTDGSVNISGNGIVTHENKPPDLLLYVIGSEDVQISGNASFYGGIYAPNAVVKNSGNGGLYGAVVAKEYFQTGNASIHFDLAMTEVQSDQRFGNLSVVAWQEKNSLTWET